jgi:hypothetical protein
VRPTSQKCWIKAKPVEVWCILVQSCRNLCKRSTLEKWVPCRVLSVVMCPSSEVCRLKFSWQTEQLFLQGKNLANFQVPAIYSGNAFFAKFCLSSLCGFEQQRGVSFVVRLRQHGKIQITWNNLFSVGWCRLGLRRKSIRAGFLGQLWKCKSFGCLNLATSSFLKALPADWLSSCIESLIYGNGSSGNRRGTWSMLTKVRKKWWTQVETKKRQNQWKRR